MGIYTKKGDKGKTSLYDGTRVKKYSLRVETYGSVDELNSQLSVAQKFCKDPKNFQLLDLIQNNLFLVAGELANEDAESFYQHSKAIGKSDTKLLENVIDEYTAKLPVLHEFILPGRSVAGAHLHLCRSVCRRAERLIDHLNDEVTIRPDVLKYVNRLSDFLYILARDEDYVDQIEGLVDKVLDNYKKEVN
ncbi:cob(I)yrinic acid a,c-diamide adenosyltransferase [Companilactobacillus versmoldensis]|uniref:Corrinoid adenosyltransferase n=1 Tax=Companilactobacillus versmoldensis DSM 14857 = KCTC 3814 TaxID=1423815 RepID=A0A0R1SGN9_9LACO|nr:cob(I)yrinic acid a,c-diamide adenosyltransferase [Companilactobacillus versmoldensis]KRL68252.1 ATP--cobalamin adenosyltransferase [Companilactobacillus versmoldensis DSM 14857 = KCTC 3814]